MTDILAHFPQHIRDRLSEFKRMIDDGSSVSRAAKDARFLGKNRHYLNEAIRLLPDMAAKVAARKTETARASANRSRESRRAQDAELNAARAIVTTWPADASFRGQDMPVAERNRMMRMYPSAPMPARQPTHVHSASSAETAASA